MIRLRDFERRDNPTRPARQHLARPPIPVRSPLRLSQPRRHSGAGASRVASTPPDHYRPELRHHPAEHRPGLQHDQYGDEHE